MRDLLTLSEVSNFLKVPKSTIYKLARERRLPGHKVGKHWRFVREEIESWVQSAGSEELAEVAGSSSSRSPVG